MVWNTTQSAFYRAIDTFNNGEKAFSDQPSFGNDRADENRGGHINKKCPKKECENRSCSDEIHRPEHSRVQRCQNCVSCHYRNTSPISDIFSDKDKLLIAGLIMILSRQNADTKLIMALVFVLLT